MPASSTATTEAAGLGTYTATFVDAPFTAQTKDVVIPKLVQELIDVYVIDDNNGENMNCYVWKDGTGAEAAGFARALRGAPRDRAGGSL